MGSGKTADNSVWRSLRTGVVVVVITLLIWFAADQSVMIEEQIKVTIRPTSLRSDSYVAFAEPPFQRDIDVRIRGRRRRLEELQLWMSTLGVVEIPVDLPDSAAPVDVSVGDVLMRRVGEIRRAGIVLDTSPEQVALRIDGYVSVPEIPIRVDYGELRVRDELEVKSVVAVVPRFVERDERFQSNRRAMVNAAPLVPDRTPGSTFDITAKPVLELPMPLQEGAIKLIPESVTIRGRIESLEVTKSKGPIAVKWSMPDTVQRNYVAMAENEDFFPHIDVRGPKDSVARLETSEIRALVEVQARDLDSPGPGKPIIRDVRFLLPPEFGDCTIVSPTQQIRFRLEPRGAGGNTQNGENGDAG